MFDGRRFLFILAQIPTPKDSRKIHIPKRFPGSLRDLFGRVQVVENDGNDSFAVAIEIGAVKIESGSANMPASVKLFREQIDTNPVVRRTQASFHARMRLFELTRDLNACDPAQIIDKIVGIFPRRSRFFKSIFGIS